ncbi:hypothetical protein Bhyg_04807 [Pseudolycoriella hygida]|uniref:SnoaL-like domain-containing protein n=1 Tax=Pseudolycoriella hygida TaxID=35572 RepID=A0A9Q0S8P3_9DIPT|nr:hypothetical protein Bhyg_04807 [Pseudolycoriella hygida]
MNAVILVSFALFASVFAITGDECLTRYQTEEDNLKLVLSFYDEAFGQHNITAVDKYISSDYIQHNPHVGDGQQPLKDFLVPFNAIKTKGPVDIRHTAVSGDIVWLHLKTTGFNGEPLAIVDIFRVKDGKIVEHWDVIQEVPTLSQSKNSHPMF